jgi:glutathione S-transferase
MADEIILHQFPFSTFNEKARWALDHKGISHRRRNLLPGPHMPIMRRMTGQSKTPVLQIGEKIICGSAQIIETLDDLFPDKPLLPGNADDRKKALEIEAWFDEDIGPRLRRAVLGKMIDEGVYMARMFSAPHNRIVRALYCATFPFAKGLIKKGNGIDSEASIEDGVIAINEALDFVSRNEGPFLAGPAFSVADVAACSHLAAALNPPDSDMTRPEPTPPNFAKWIETNRARAGADWVLSMYRDHRPKKR